MLAPVAALVVALTAPAPPAWVAQHQCVAAPASDLACDADPVPNATLADLGACACNLLTAADLAGCDELRDNGGRALTVDRKLARAKAGQPPLVAAIGALSAMRVVAMTEREFTVDEFTDRTLKRSVEDILHEMP